MASSADPIDELLDHVDDTPLVEDDLRPVLKALIEVLSEWKPIGIGFGLKSSKLEEIEETHHNNLKKCLIDVITNWLRKNYDTVKFGEPSWRKVVEIVADPAAGDNVVLAKAIAEKHPCVQASSVSAENKSISNFDSRVSELNSKLQILINVPDKDEHCEESKKVMVKAVVEDFIEKSKVDPEEIKRGLAEIYASELLLSKEIYEWALEKLAAIPPSSMRSSPDSPEEVKAVELPLFCKDTVFHASLCCVAVSSRNSSNYKGFFTRDFPNHCFEEVSMSICRDGVDRYLIARKGKTYFIAFQSESSFSKWQQQYRSFEQGIEIQTERIPLRFLIKQLHDGYRIVCTGYRFGGTLALSVATSLWRSPLICTSVLEKNLCCISLSPPLIHFPSLQEVIAESPQINSTLHSIFIQDDFMPRLTMFLDPKNETILKEVEDHKPLSSMKVFQDVFASNLFNYISLAQIAAESKLESNDAFGTMKSLLLKTWPHLLAKRIKSDDGFVPSGCIHVINTRPGEGLVWNKLAKSQVAEEIIFMKSEDIEGLKIFSLFKNHTVSYHEKIFKSFVKESPHQMDVSPSEVKAVRPVVNSVSFHRYGKEFSITITGENLWFCNEVKVGALRQVVSAKSTTQKCLQFNLNIEDHQQFPGTADHISVKVWSHFTSPVTNDKTEVKHKVYHFTFRQEQLAKLTPSELIEAAYLSALLEQQPHATAVRGFSHRFESLRMFLTKVVIIVPIESLVHAISETDDLSIALKCCKQLMVSNLTLQQPSSTLLIGLEYAMHMFVANSYESVPTFSKAKTPSEHSFSLMKEHQSLLNVKYNKRREERRIKKDIAYHDSVNSPLTNSICRGALFGLHGHLMSQFHTNEAFRRRILDSSVYKSELDFLFTQLCLMQEWKRGFFNAICGKNLEDAYPVRMIKSSEMYPLQSPLQILKKGRKQIHWLQSKSSAEITTQAKAPEKLSQLYNSKMLEKVNEIRKESLAVCTLLLGAFMEEQMRVPLMKTSFDTARAIEIATSATAVGVWALFSLTFGDVEAMISAIPSRSHILVEVKEYIKGIFKQDVATADENYAGKLQFMIQGMNKMVSCNSHYVSYSLERQLLELCTKLKINESTPLETLVSDWDQIFKDNVMSFVVHTHRSLIARWLKWALMVHQLREELARYTAVGVVGLVNSGKSLLVSTLFDIKIPVGTTAVKRTTVPFLYSMDGVVDGLDVIDFPGVDDRDETISELAELLLVIAQVVVFVVDYRKAHTESAKKWLEILEDKSVPVLVCLTYADKLYAECMGKDGSHPKPQDIKHKIAEETDMMLEQLGRVPSRSVQFFSFSQDRDSILNTPDGRSKLRGAGIGTPQDVGDWLAKIFESQLDQDELAKKLRDLVHRKDI